MPSRLSVISNVARQIATMNSGTGLIWVIKSANNYNDLRSPLTSTKLNSLKVSCQSLSMIVLPSGVYWIGAYLLECSNK